MPDEMASLQSIIRPNLGIITNITDEHRDGFDSIRTKCAEKVTLLRDCDCIIYNADNELISEAIQSTSMPAQEIAWSLRDSDRPLFISRIAKHQSSTVIDHT